MRRGSGPQSLALLLLLLACLALQGDGNEGSSAGSCSCSTTYSSESPPRAQIVKHLREQLKGYDRCPFFVRFRLPQRTVCGGSKDPWVIKLVRCFDHKECGRANSKGMVHQEHLPSPSTQAPKPTERAPSDVGTSAQPYLPPILLQHTQQPTLPAGVLSLNKNLTHANETTISSVGHNLEAGPEAGANQKQLEEHVGPTAQTSTMVPVLSLLGIVFLLTGVLLFVLCKRRREQSLQRSPDLRLHYTPMATDSIV